MNRVKLLLLAVLALVGMIATAQVRTGTAMAGSGPPVKFLRTIDPKSFFPAINPGTVNKGVLPQRPKQPPKFTTSVIPAAPIPSGQNGGASDGAFQVLGFPGLQYDSSGYYPPDPHCAVGPNNVVQVVNVRVGIFTKTGTKLLEQTFDSGGFFGTTTAKFNFDPKVIYDPQSGHYFLVALSTDDANKISNFLLAVSTTSNPMDKWNVYEIPNAQTDSTGAKYWIDYPSMTVTTDSLVLEGNAFGFVSGGLASYLFMFDKAALISKGTVASAQFAAGNWSVQLARPDTVGPAAYGASFNDPDGSIYKITRNGNTWTVQQAVVALQKKDVDSGGTTIKTGSAIDTIGDRFIDDSIQGTKLAFAMTIGTNGNANFPEVQWWEFNVATFPPVAKQTGVIKSSSVGYSMPGIGYNGNGSMAVVASQSISKNGDMAVLGRRQTDPLGATGTIGVMHQSDQSAKDTGFRWGDYAVINPDLTNPNYFWATADYLNGTGDTHWGTWISQFSLSRHVLQGATTVAPVYGAMTGTVASLAAVDSSKVTVNSTLLPGRGQYAAFDVQYKLSFNGAPDLSVSSAMDMFVTAGDTATLNVQFYNNVTGQWDFIKALQLSSTEAAMTANLTASGAGNVNQYVNGVTNILKVRYIAFKQYRQAGVAPTAFTLSADYTDGQIDGIPAS